jgi:transposase
MYRAIGNGCTHLMRMGSVSTGIVHAELSKTGSITLNFLCVKLYSVIQSSLRMRMLAMLHCSRVRPAAAASITNGVECVIV